MAKPIRRKAKKSYTLSAESVEFLEALRRKRGAPSISAVLEELLQVARREHVRAKVDVAIANYYSSLSDEEIGEQAAWGRFALREFPKESA